MYALAREAGQFTFDIIHTQCIYMHTLYMPVDIILILLLH